MTLNARVSKWLRRAFRPEDNSRFELTRIPRLNWLRPRVEILEDRIAPAVFGSTNTVDNLTVNTFGANDVLSLEISGAATYDRVTSSASQVGGTLFVQFRGYNPTAGQQFTLINFASTPTDFAFDRSIAIVSDTADQFKTFLNASGDLVLEVVDAATQAAQATFQTLAGIFSYNTASVDGGTAYAISATNVKLALPDPVDNLFGNLGSATFNGSLILVEAGANSGLAGSLTGDLNLTIPDVTLSGTLGIRVNTSGVAINLPDVDPGAGVLPVNVPAGPFFGVAVDDATLDIGNGTATLTGDFAFEIQGANLHAFADVNAHINLGTIAGVNADLDVANYLAIIDYNAALEQFTFNISGPIKAPYVKDVGQATGNITIDLSGLTAKYWGAAALTTQSAFTKLALVGVTPTGPNKAWVYLNSDAVAHDVTITFPDLTTQAVHVKALSFGMGIEANLQWVVDGETWFTLDEGVFDLRISADTGATLFVNADLKVGDPDAPLLTLDAQGAIILSDDGDANPTEAGEGAAGVVALTATGNPFDPALGIALAGTFVMVFNTCDADKNYTPPAGVNVPSISFPIVIPGGPPPAGTAPTANTWDETTSGDYLLIHADAQLTFLNSLTVDGDLHMVVSTDGIDIHAAGDLDLKVGGTTILGFDADGMVSVTSAGVQADISLTQTVNAPSGFTIGAGTSFRLQVDTVADEPYARVRGTGSLDVGGFSIDAVYDITVFTTYLNIHVVGTMDVMAGATKVFGFTVNGDLHVGTDGLAASIDLSQSITTPASLGFSFATDFSFEVNTFSTDKDDSIDLGLTTGPYVRLHATGSVKITAIELSLIGNFDVFYVGTNLKLDIGATVSVLGTTLTLDGEASLSPTGLAIDLALTGEALYPSSSFEISGTLKLHIDTDPGDFEAYVAVTNAEVNLFGFVMTGGFKIGISSSGFSIAIPTETPLSLDFFDIVTFSVSGSLNSNGTFSFTASTGFDFTDDDLDVGVSGTMSVTINNSGFSGSLSGSAVIFGETIAGISATVSVSGGSVSLSFSATITITPEITIDLPSVTVYYPDPSWDDPFNWSSYTYDPPPETIPAVRVSKSFTLTLGAVSPPQAPPPAPLVLAHLDGSTLYLHMGTYAGLRNQFTTDNGESFFVSHVAGSAGNETVRIKAFGAEQDFSGVSKIVVTDAGEGDDVVNVLTGVLASVDLNGGVGHDTLAYAGSGTAKLTGGEGNDLLSGGSGNDELHGGAGDDHLQGSAGADKLNGEADNDKLEGGAGNDELYGGTGNDRLQGGENDDRLEGGQGADQNYGDGGSDQIVWKVDDGSDTRVDGGLGGDTFTVAGTNSGESASVGAAGDNNSFTVTFAGATLSAGISIESLVLDGKGGADAFTVNDSGAALSTHLGAITLKLGGDSSADSVTINGSSGTDVFSVSTAAGVGSVGRPADGKGGPAGLTTYIEQAGIGEDTLTLDLAGGDDIAHVKSTLGGLATTIKGGAGDSRIYIGSNAPPTAGNLNGIAGALTIQGGANTDYLYLDDTADTAGNIGTLTSSQVTGLGLGSAGISYSGVDQLEIKLGSGGDTFTIASTHSGTTTTLKTNGGADTVHIRMIAKATTVETGSENDTINVGSTAGDVNGIAALLILDGGTHSGGSDTLNVDDTTDIANNTGTLTNSLLTGLGMTSGIAYSALELLNINLGSGGDTFSIQSTAGTTTTVLKTGVGNDTINLGGNAPAVGGNVNAVAGGVTIHGEDGADTLNVDDTGDNAANTGALTNTQLTGLGMTVGISYSTLESLNLNLGKGDDVFTIASTHDGTTTLNANNGADTVHVRTISGATNVFTGAADDVINVGSNAGVSGNPAGNVNALAALLTVDGGGQGAKDQLNVDDTADTLGNTGNLIGTDLTGLGMAAGVDYSALEEINIRLGSGGDTFTIQSTHAGTTSLFTNGGPDTVHVRKVAGLTQVATGAGDDTVNVGSTAPGALGTLDGIAALLAIDGGLNLDTVNVDDTGTSSALAGTLTKDLLTGLDMPDTGGIGYTGLEAFNLALGTGGTTMLVPSTNLGSRTRITGNSGNEVFNVGSTRAANAGNLNLVQGQLTLIGGGGNDQLNVNDHGATGAYNYTLSPTALVNDPTPVPVQTLPTPSVPPARTFAGIVYNASDRDDANTIQTVRLDGTDQVNIFTVRPSEIAEYLVNGNLPASGVPLPGGGDYLKLDTTGTTGRKLHIHTVDGVPPPGSGHWGFTSAHQDVSFTSIERFNHVDILAVAQDVGTTSSPIVKVYDAETMEFKFQVTPYEPTFRGGVRVATGDVNFDGIPDLITAPGIGRAVTIKVFNGTPDADGNYPANYLANFNQIASFDAYPETFRGGAYVAVGDVNGDGANDIVTGPGAGTGPLVKVFNGTTLTTAAPTLIGKAFHAFAATFRGGVTVAAGDINKDGKAEVVVGSGAGMTATVRVFDGQRLTDSAAIAAAIAPKRAIVPFGAFNKGVFVTVGDFNGDGFRDVIVGAGAGTTALVNVYTGATVYAATTAAPARLASITAYATTFRGGVRVAAKPLFGGDPGSVERVGIFTAPGINSLTRNVRRAIFNTPASISLVDQVFMDASFVKGIWVG